MIGAGKPIQSVTMLILNVFIMRGKKDGEFINSIKCLNPTHSLPKTPNLGE